MRAGLLGCKSSRNTNWALLPSCSQAAFQAKHLHFCSLGRMLSSSCGSVTVIYSSFKQTQCKHCRFPCPSPIFATLRGINYKPESCIWDCLAPDELVCVNMRIWLIRLSSTVAPWWQQKDMISCLSWLQTSCQSVHWDVKHWAFLSVWTDRLNC